jgi:excisionase family DNA binding protein
VGEKKIRELWTMTDLIAYLKVPRATAYYYISIGKIPFVQIGRHKRFVPDDVERAVKKLPT